LVEKLVGNKTIQKQVVIKNPEKGILYGSSCLFGKGKGCSGIWEWYESKNEKTDHIYEGEILNGVPHGKGKNTDEHGNYFTGNYKDGIEFGIGTLDMVKNNSKYIGEFKDGQIISGTQHFYNSGNRYEGEFHNGKRNGQGTFYYKKNNTKFVGNWKNGKKFNGIMYNDNEKNIGEWKDGLKQK